MTRKIHWFGGALLLAISFVCVAAGSLDAVSSKDAAGGMRAAISQGIDKAIAQLGAPNGFLNNPKYTIPLPSGLEKADRALRMIGMSGDADKLKEAMNHAAEMAVADAKPVFKQAAQKMTVADAKGILTGGPDSATQYFRTKTETALTAHLVTPAGHPGDAFLLDTCRELQERFGIGHSTLQIEISEQTHCKLAPDHIV